MTITEKLHLMDEIEQRNKERVKEWKEREKKVYTADDARREVKECLQEGYGFDYIRIFLNDLKRGGDITKDEWNTIFFELVDGKLGKVNCSYGTY